MIECAVGTDAIREVLNTTQEQAEEAYADFFCKDALERWPTWFTMSKNAREFLEKQPRIHHGFATSVRIRKFVGPSMTNPNCKRTTGGS